MPPGFLDRIIYDLCDTLYANLNSTHASIKSPRINIPNVWRALVSSYHNNTRILEEHPQWYPFHTWCKLSRATRYGVCKMKLRWEVCGTVGDAIPPTNDRDPTAFFRVQMKYSDSIRGEMNEICITSHSFVVQKSSHSGDWAALYVKHWQQFPIE